MATIRRIALVIAIGSLLVGCGSLPVPIRDPNLIVMSVHNASAKPVALVVAMPADVGTVVGLADPPILPAGATTMVAFRVPPGGGWAIWAGLNELMGGDDVGQRRGNVPMGIDIDQAGEVSWWCRDDCP